VPDSKFLWFKPVLLFILSYSLCLALWLPVKKYYAAGIACSGAMFAMVLHKEVLLDGMEMRPDSTVMTYNFSLRDVDTTPVYLTIYTSAYTFNVPLIVSLLAAFLPFLEKKTKHTLIILAAVLGSHFLHVVAEQINGINIMLKSAGFMTGGKVWDFCRRFLSEWIDYLFARFMPFLCGFYLLANSSFFKKMPFVQRAKG
jgi:hypothetical protein